MTQNYKKAFKCNRCPQNNTENGCPMWWETPWRNIEDGEIKILKGCGYQQMNLYVTEMTRAANGTTASFDKLTNMMNTHLVNLCAAVQTALQTTQKQLELQGQVSYNNQQQQDEDYYDGR